jgi:hypothetical protein
MVVLYWIIVSKVGIIFFERFIKKNLGTKYIFKGSELWKRLCYILMTTFYGICIAAEWGCEFAYIAFYHIWIISPLMKIFEINCGLCQRIYANIVNCCNNSKHLCDSFHTQSRLCTPSGSPNTSLKCKVWNIIWKEYLVYIVYFFCLFTSSYNKYDHNFLACSWVFFLPDPLNIYLVPRFFLINLSKNIIPTFDTIIQ